jgi:hypothetical protein
LVQQWNHRRPNISPKNAGHPERRLPESKDPSRYRDTKPSAWLNTFFSDDSEGLQEFSNSKRSQELSCRIDPLLGLACHPPGNLRGLGRRVGEDHDFIHAGIAVALEIVGNDPLGVW